MIKKKAHTYIGTLHFDNVGEYISVELKNYLSQH